MTTPSPISDAAAAVVDPDSLPSSERAAAWMARCQSILDGRVDDILKHRAYMENEQPPKFQSDAWEETFGETYGELRNNHIPLTVRVTTQKQQITGWRDSKGKPCAEAAKFWADNEMDVMADALHDDLSAVGYAYVLVWADKQGNPRITPEDPVECCVVRDPEDRRTVLAGVKRWRDAAKVWHAFLLTPDVVWRMTGGKDECPETWDVVSANENPYGAVTLVEFVNNPTVRGEGRSDIKDLEPLQDFLNKTTMDKAVASEYTSFRQRVLLNCEIPKDEHGNPLAAVEMAVNRFITLNGEASEGPDGTTMQPDIRELEASDLSNYTKVEGEIKADIATLAQIPPQHLLGGAMSNIGGDALTQANEGHVSRVRSLIKQREGSWLKVMRFAYRVAGLAQDAVADVVWRNPEITTESAYADNLSKYAAAGVPRKAAWELAGADDEQVARWAEMARQEAEEEAHLEALRMGISPGGSSVQAEPRGGDVPPADEAAE